MNFTAANSEIRARNAGAAGDISFNTGATQGAITVTGGASNFGLINAATSALDLGAVTFNGGANPVNVYVEEIRGCIGGTGSPLTVLTNVSNLAGIGNVTAAGDFTYIAPDVLLCGFVDAGGIVTLGADGSVTAVNPLGIQTNTVTQPNGVGTFFVTGGTGVNLVGSTFNLGDATTATTGAINVSDSGFGAGGITVNFTNGTNSTMTASGAGGGINFTSANGIDANNNPGAGVLDAGANNIAFNGGTGETLVDVNQIIAACTGATGTNVTLRTLVGSLNVGNVNANGTILVQTQDANGNIVTCGNITNVGPAGTSTFQAGTSATGTGSVTIGHTVTSDGNVLVEASGQGGGNSVSINVGGSVASNSGSVTVTGDTINVADTAAINDINAATGIVLTGDAVNNTAGQIVTAAGNVTVDARAAGGALAVANTGTVEATTGNILVNSLNPGGTITVTDGAGTGILNASGAGGFVQFGNSTTLNGTENIVLVTQEQIIGNVQGIGNNGAGVGNPAFSITTTGAGDALNTGEINVNNGDLILSSQGAVLVNDNATVQAGNIDIDSQGNTEIGRVAGATHTVSTVLGNIDVDVNGTGSFRLGTVGTATGNLEATGAGGTITVNVAATGNELEVGDQGAGSITADQDITLVNAGSGEVSIGDDALGTVLSNNGNISITSANDLEVSDSAAANGSSIVATNGNVSLDTTGAGDDDIFIGDGGTALVQAGGTITMTTVSTSGDIEIGRDTGSDTSIIAVGDITINSRDGAVIGDESVATVRSDTGNIVITAQDEDLDIANAAGSGGTSITATAGNITINTTGTFKRYRCQHRRSIYNPGWRNH